MKSTNNVYIANLDHLRAFAAFLVFVFHFVHNSVLCNIICLDQRVPTPFPPFSLLEEGHSGVALFMCLSGYIFAYLTCGSSINPFKFAWNRILRLLPLIAFWGIIIRLFYPFEPVTGTWSVIIELQFYAVLPVLLIYTRAYGFKPLLIVVAISVAYRTYEWTQTGTVMALSYYTLVGRIDQLVLGMLAFYLERRIKKSARPQAILATLGIAGFITVSVFYYGFSLHGGFEDYSIRSAAWIVIPTIEGVCYCFITLFYLQLALPVRLNRFLSWLGGLSYSIYLNHFLLIPIIIPILAATIGMPDGFYGRLLLAGFIGFPLVVAFSMLTNFAIEKPFLRYRSNYLRNPESVA